VTHSLCTLEFQNNRHLYDWILEHLDDFNKPDRPHQYEFSRLNLEYTVMSQGFGYPAFPVDTHIHRLAQRWGLTNGKNVIQTEDDLKRLFPKNKWNKLHLQIIYYGREYCKARDCYGISCKICTSCYPKRKKPFIAKKP